MVIESKKHGTTREVMAIRTPDNGRVTERTMKKPNTAMVSTKPKDSRPVTRAEARNCDSMSSTHMPEPITQSQALKPMT